jgi:hypothetical protein
VQLIGTAHGNALDNLLLNPTLSDLIGGIQSVTLSDEEARRRGTQKTVLERRAPPTFDVLVEIQTRDRMIVHEDVAAAVDAILRERPLPVEVRYRNENGEVLVEQAQPEIRSIAERNTRGERTTRNGKTRNGRSDGYEKSPAERSRPHMGTENRGKAMTVYAYGVARNRLQQAARRLHLPLTLVDEPAQVDMIVTLKNYYRRRPKLIVDAERKGTPIYVLRANTVSQMENFLTDVFGQDREAGTSEDPFGGAMRETKDAILQVRNGIQYVDLAPQAAPIRRRQHEMAHKARLDSESYGDEPIRFVRIFRPVDD